MKVSLIGVMGNDLSVVNAARVSFDKSVPFGNTLSEKDERLIMYLAKHKHKSPFNHAFLSFRVEAPIFVARQLVKHEYLTWNEVSRRYVDTPPTFYFPEQWRGRAKDKKQGSDINFNMVNIDLPFEDIYDGHDGYEVVYKTCSMDEALQNAYDPILELYEEMIRQGCAPEQARMILPQNMMTQWIWSGSLGAFMKMLSLRLKEDTQQETREIAQMVSEHIKHHFPTSYQALTEHPIL